MNNIDQPLISVCIPVYNCEQFVGLAIESVLGQTYKNFELVVLDNCSTDNTLSVIHGYDDVRIRIIENATNIGAAANWNLGVSECKGQYIKLLCSDDLLYPECLEKQVKCLESPTYANVVLICCGRDVVDDQGNILLKRNFKGADGMLSGGIAIKKTLRAGANMIGEPSAVLFRSEVVKGMGGFDGEMNYVIDLDFWCRLLLRGDIYVLPQTFCAFRVLATSWSVKATDTQYSDFCRLLTKMYDDSNCKISRADMIQGELRAYINKALRLLFYKFVLKKA